MYSILFCFILFTTDLFYSYLFYLIVLCTYCLPPTPFCTLLYHVRCAVHTEKIKSIMWAPVQQQQQCHKHRPWIRFQNQRPWTRFQSPRKVGFSQSRDSASSIELSYAHVSTSLKCTSTGQSIYFCGCVHFTLLSCISIFQSLIFQGSFLTILNFISILIFSFIFIFIFVI